MPAHSSHILQPLDVGCFSPLKTAYRRQVKKLIRNRFNYITKLEFLPAFRDAFDASITKIPFDLDKVISKLDVTWQSKTPKNYHEFGSQTKLITDKLGSLLSSLKDGFSTGQNKSTKDPTTASSSSKKGCRKVRANRAELTQRRCSNYSGTGHNARTYKINEDSTIESSSNENSTITNSTVK
ncbi:DDE-domain-containing protein [Zopfia rhizophila CBS 207.26]|uniref:DDE-domain-containing protein n=1 Tax=Zopfia rhizophila CBS 207.26 TaxID=1314779 RepID=A0A6A6D9C9_9PEZI|nr:DDE-domain-containing protein [Zopfia rhizophila CBS 207.26]KAF2194012.1 DDE-domain-containing protein [Zopfia rhizophila CBS 207.26]